MQLSQNQIHFLNFFFVSEIYMKLKHFENEDEPQRLFLSETIEYKNRGYLNA